MPKSPPDDPSGYYHVMISLDALEQEPLDEDAVNIRRISQNEAETLARLFRDVNRNQPCPCGSGLKFKKCCLRRAN